MFRGHIYWQISGYISGPLAKIGSSAKFGVAVFKASMLDSLGGPSGKVGSSVNFGVMVFQASILDYPGEGIHLSKYLHLPSFVYWYSRQISCVRVEISYCHLGGVSGVFWACFRHVLGVFGVSMGLHLTSQYNAN